MRCFLWYILKATKLILKRQEGNRGRVIPVQVFIHKERERERDKECGRHGEGEERNEREERKEAGGRKEEREEERVNLSWAEKAVHGNVLMKLSSC